MIAEASDNSGAAGIEARQIHDLVKQAAEPEGFHLFELRFGEDSTGDAAVWISFLLDPSYPTTPSSIQVLGRLRQAVLDKLFEQRIGRVPYIRFRTRREAAG